MQEEAERLLQKIQKAKTGNLSTEISSETYAQKQARWYNEEAGGLSGYNCPICNNKGTIAYVPENGLFYTRDCECMKIRESMRRIEKSGLQDLMKIYTFDNFITSFPWQMGAKQMALDFLKDYTGKWFFAGGQPGCGKTHLCTAITSEFMNMGKSAHYMLWRDEIVPLKANVTDHAAYSNAIRRLKEIDVLYIDDFLKTDKGASPTSADVSIAFEILNYRYNNSNLITIISSEKMFEDIIKIDEAVGSRIYHRAQQYSIIVDYDQQKNYRLHGETS